MSSGTVVVGSLLGLALAALYARVGALVARSGGGSAAPERLLFSAFWVGVATYGALDAGWALALAVGPVPLDVAVTVLHAKIACGVVAFAGLVAYLLVVYTGRRALVPVVGLGYLALYVVVEYYYVWREPVGQHLGQWSAGLDYARDGGAFHDVVTMLLFVPPALAAAAYALLLVVVRERPARLRVGVTSLSLVVFFAGLTLGWLNGKLPWWALAEKALALGAGLALLWALSPSTRPAGRTATSERPQQV